MIEAPPQIRLQHIFDLYVIIRGFVVADFFSEINIM